MSPKGTPTDTGSPPPEARASSHEAADEAISGGEGGAAADTSPTPPMTKPRPAADSSSLPQVLDDPALYINRELSLLEFNRRVLEQAKNPEIPILERLRFLAICSLNLDEFFEIRVAGLHQQIALEVASTGPDKQTPAETQRRVSEVAHGLVKEQYRVLTKLLLPALDEEGIRLIFRPDWDDRIRRWVKGYFTKEVLPVLTPVGLDPAHPFPMLLNKSLNFLVALEGKDAFGRSSRVAVVQAPRLLPRLITLPEKVGGGRWQFVTLSGVIHDNVGALFPGMKVTGCYPFRVTRNSDMWVDEEEVDDLLRALKGELRRRNFGDGVRLEVSRECPKEMCQFLLRQFELAQDDLYKAHGPVNLNRLAVLYDLVDRPDLKYPPFLPSLPAKLSTSPDWFGVLRKGDVLLHHPFEAFTPVMELLEQAARDPYVLAIKVTLYRTGMDSPFTDALLDAARNGKEVTAVVELRARFDEEANIDIATRLQQAGVKVAYGIVGYKAHAKMVLILRRERDGLRRYVHLGTGNYHPRTTRQYTDFSLLTCDPEYGDDVHSVFQQLTGLGKVGRLKRLIQSPFALHDRLIELVDKEAEIARSGRTARIRAKMNSLTEAKLIAALYRASVAGVQIDLVVRGICSLRPGVPGVSDNIRVRSIVGRFLEHSRVFHFHGDGEEVVWCSSADWMPRNLFHRVEVAFPVDDPKLRKRVLEEGIDVYLADTTNAWELKADGTYERVNAEDAAAVSAQEVLLERLSDRRP